jgi:hypothetical protein
MKVKATVRECDYPGCEKRYVVQRSDSWDAEHFCSEECRKDNADASPDYGVEVSGAL